MKSSPYVNLKSLSLIRAKPSGGSDATNFIFTVASEEEPLLERDRAAEIAAFAFLFLLFNDLNLQVKSMDISETIKLL
jgi:hypothetical protein